MGKDLKGKELGTGLSQLPDERYIARFTDKRRNRVQKTFDSLVECKKWLADSIYNDEHSKLNKDITFDNWYKLWFENKKRMCRSNTIRGYEQKYRLYIKKHIGNIPISNIIKIQCQQVLNEMGDKGLTVKSLNVARIIMHSVFEYAVENELLDKNPCNRLNIKVGRKNNKVYALTLLEQEQILNGIRKSPYFIQIALLLQTGLRTSELRGLKWSDIDFENKTLSVNKQLVYIGKEFMFNEPKTETGIRTIPLTDEAIRLLKLKKSQKNKSKVIDIKYKDLIFLTYNGTPIYDQYYNKTLKKVADKNNIDKKVTLHVLRHTFATRCVEAGVNPKALQHIMGHADIGVTMNLYVDATDDEKRRNIDVFQSKIKII